MEMDYNELEAIAAKVNFHLTPANAPGFFRKCLEAGFCEEQKYPKYDPKSKFCPQEGMSHQFCPTMAGGLPDNQDWVLTKHGWKPTPRKPIDWDQMSRDHLTRLEDEANALEELARQRGLLC
jgi:hypothetical protein